MKTVSYKTTRTENTLVGYNNNDYYEFSNTNVGDTIEIEKPLLLEYSTNNMDWTTVDLSRDSLNQGQLSFNIEGLDANELFFRVSDSGESQNIITLTNIQINFNQLRN